MTVCSVNTGPGLLPPVHWRRLEIRVLPDIVSAIRLLWWADIFFPPVYGDRDSEPSVSAVSPHSHTASGSYDHLHTEGVRRISWNAIYF